MNHRFPRGCAPITLLEEEKVRALARLFACTLLDEIEERACARDLDTPQPEEAEPEYLLGRLVNDNR